MTKMKNYKKNNLFSKTSQMAEPYLIMKDVESYQQTLEGLPPATSFYFETNTPIFPTRGMAGKLLVRQPGLGNRIRFMNHQVEELNQQKLVEQKKLIQAAAQTLTSLKDDNRKYHYHCDGGCTVLLDYPWFKEFKPGRVCQQCFGKFYVTRANRKQNRHRSVRRSGKSCQLCKHRYRSDADFVCHSIMGKCAKTRES